MESQESGSDKANSAQEKVADRGQTTENVTENGDDAEVLGMYFSPPHFTSREEWPLIGKLYSAARI